MATKRVIRIDLNITRTDNRRAVLELETGKQYYGVGAEAQVGWHDHQGFREIALGIGGGGDYSRKVMRLPKGKPATQGNIDHCHVAAFTPEMIAEVTEQARAWSQRVADREAEQAASRDSNSSGMGGAVAELMAEGIDASTALRMLNID